MGGYLLIESRATAETPDVAGFLAFATGLADRGHPVDLYLVQNAALMAGRHVEPLLDKLCGRDGVAVWVDDASLASRLGPRAPLAAGVRVAPMAQLVRLLMRPGCTPVWH
jgi:predicted peroxiredoxin